MLDQNKRKNPEVIKIFLPTLGEKLVSTNPDDWPEVGQTAYVPHFAVIVDPEQPRNTDGILETNEHKTLAESTDRRGQGLIVRVRLLTKSELEEETERNPRARYRIVDGERRFHAVGPDGAKTGVIEITVHEYNDPRDIHLDQVILNTQQLPLNTPELVRALKKIKEDYQIENNSELARKVSMTQGLVNDHCHLAELDPEILEFTDQRKYKQGQRLAIKPAVALARIKGIDDLSAHERQREILNEALDKGIKGALRQVAFFEQFHDDITSSHREKREPRRARSKLETLFSVISSRDDLLELDAGALDRALSTVSVSIANEFLKKAQKARDDIAKLVSAIEAAVERHSVKRGSDGVDLNYKKVSTPAPASNPPKPGTKEVGNSETARRFEAYRSKQGDSDKPVVADSDEKLPVPPREPEPKVLDPAVEEQLKKSRKLVAAAKSSDNEVEPERKISPLTRSAGEGETNKKPSLLPISATYWDDTVCRFVGGSVDSKHKFKKLWEGKCFDWQREEREKPAGFPTLEEVCS